MTTIAFANVSCPIEKKHKEEILADLSEAKWQTRFSNEELRRKWIQNRTICDWHCKEII